MLIQLIIRSWICVFLLLGVSHAAAFTVLDRAALELELAGAAAPTHRAEISLPYHWNLLHGDVGGHARFSFAFSSSNPQAAHAIHIPHVGNTFEVSINGVVIGKMGSPGDRYADFGKQPRFFRIPSGILRDQNTMDITIDVQGGRNGGLSPVLVGMEEDIRAAHESSRLWQTTGPLVVVVVSCVLGILAFLLWLRQRELLYLYYSSAEFFWAIYVGDALIERPPLPWPWWGVIIYSAEALAAVLIFKFSLLVIGRHNGLLKRMSDWNLLLTVPVVLIGVLFGLVQWGEQFWKFVTDTVSLCIIVTVIRHGFFHKELEKRVLAIGLLLITCVGMRDELMLVILPYLQFASGHQTNHFGALPWTRYAWVLFGFSLAWIIAERMRRSAQEIAGMNLRLSQRLATREQELNAAFTLQAHSERQQAMLEERQRLMRDMHDGFGSQLVGALQLAQNPAVSKEVLSGQLRETLDHLRMTVDAMQDTQGDIASLLGALRYRLNTRLTAANVQLEWAVEPLPEIAGWTLQDSRDLQMILFEAFSNLIVHAGATQATLQAQKTPQGGIGIVLQDNGRGFDVNETMRAGGHGLANMRTRAARLGAELHIESAPEGTRTTFTLPPAGTHR